MVAALIDEACGLVATWYRFPTVTGRMFLRYRRPVPINTPLSVRAWVEDEKARRVYVRGELWESGELLAEARLAFVHVPLEHFLETPEGRAHAEAWRTKACRAAKLKEHRRSASRPSRVPDACAERLYASGTVLGRTGRSQEGGQRREAAAERAPPAGSRTPVRDAREAPTRIELVYEALQASA